MTFLIAHRGDTISFEENTLEAFLSAFIKGAKGIELDIHLFNGEIIVVHDFLFNRNKKYPNLEEILEQINTKGRIEIEIKSFDTVILKPLKAILDKFPKSDFELTTSEIPLAKYIKEYFPEIPLGLIYHDFLFENWMTTEVVLKKIAGWGRMAKADRVHISLKVVSQFGGKYLVDEIHKAGFIVHSHIYNTENQKNDLDTIKLWGIDQCTFENLNLIDPKNSS